MKREHGRQIAGAFGQIEAMPKTLSPRQIAIRDGAKHYEGKPCGTCGETKRYTKQGSCVHCNNRRTKTPEHYKIILDLVQ